MLEIVRSPDLSLAFSALVTDSVRSRANSNANSGRSEESRGTGRRSRRVRAQAKPHRAGGANGPAIEPFIAGMGFRRSNPIRSIILRGIQLRNHSLRAATTAAR